MVGQAWNDNSISGRKTVGMVAGLILGILLGGEVFKEEIAFGIGFGVVIGANAGYIIGAAADQLRKTQAH